MIDFKPSENYEELLIQSRGLQQLANSYWRSYEYWKSIATNLMKRDVSINKKAIEAERIINEQLTNYIEELERRLDEILS